MATTATSLVVKILGDDSDLKKKIQGIEKNFEPLRKNLAKVGSAMTKFVTLPLLAAGAASAKLATDFEASMTKIETLVGIAGDQVDQWGADILKLAPKLGKAPRELSEALFVVTSAGQRGAEAMRVLENAAKASAIGLGETRDVARAVTSAMTAYGPEVLSASEATDILTATIREGNLEASQLAPVIGRILGPAAQLGIGFGELGANIATFTRLGVSASEAVTGLRGILSVLLRPTEQARKAADELGISFDAVRETVRNEGLNAALAELLETADGNTEALGRLFPEVEALSNVLGTAGSQGKEYARIARDMANATGITDEAFKKVADTAKFKFDAALASLQTSGIKIGNNLLPILNDLADVTADVSTSFSNLDDAVQEMIVTMAGVAVVVGPLISLGMKLGATMSLVAGGFVLAAGGAAFFHRAAKDLDQSGVLKGSGLTDWKAAVDLAGGAADTAVPKVSALQEALVGAGFNIGGLSLGAQALVKGLEDAGNAVSDTASDVDTKFNPALDTVNASLDETIARIKFLTSGMLSLGQLAFADLLSGRKMDVSFDPTGQKPSREPSVIEKMAKDLGLANPKLREAGDAVRIMDDNMQDLSLSGGLFVHSLSSGLGQIVESTLLAEDGFKGIEDAINNLGSVAQRVLARMVADLAAAAAKAALLTFLFPTSAAGAGGIGGIFKSLLGFREHGGPVMANRPYIVGESGPELLIPRGSGTVVPNNMMGSTQNIRLHVTGRLVGEGGQLVAVIDQHKSFLDA